MQSLYKLFALFRRLGGNVRGTFQKEPRPTVVMVLWRTDQFGEFQVLVVLSARALRRDGRLIWLLPQGGILPGETPYAAAVRELSEELGIAESDLKSLHGPLLTGQVPGGDKRYILVAASYWGKDELDLNLEEITHARWVSLSDAASKISRANHKKKIEILLDGIRKTHALVCA